MILSMSSTQAFDAYVRGGKSRTNMLTSSTNCVTFGGLEKALWMKPVVIIAGPH